MATPAGWSASPGGASSLLSILLLIVTGILQNIPPVQLEDLRGPHGQRARRAAEAAQTTEALRRSRTSRRSRSKRTSPSAKGETGYEISIDERGVRITPEGGGRAGGQRAPAASVPGQLGCGHRRTEPSVEINLPPGATSEVVREAVEEARRAIIEAIEEAKDEAEVTREERPSRRRGRPQACARADHASFGDSLPELAFLWIVASAIIKITYKGRMQAEVKAAQATETAEAESLKRQVVEARMAAMQAQVEPHFLFNTLASIDHLIETDPARASADAEEPDRAAARQHADDARGQRRRRARPGARAGGDPALPRDPEGAHGRAPAHRDRRARRACCRPSSRR